MEIEKIFHFKHDQTYLKQVLKSTWTDLDLQLLKGDSWTVVKNVTSGLKGIEWVIIGFHAENDLNPLQVRMEITTTHVL